jgi:ribosome-associated heat shock protein Hsp15
MSATERASHQPGTESDRLRLDRLLVYLRFARTRSVARTMIEQAHMRVNAERVRKTSREVAVGDVITLAVGDEVRVIEVVALPTRRASPALAKSHYRELDPWA